MTGDSGGIAEEIVELEYYFLPPDRQAEVDYVLRALQEHTRLEFLLAVFKITVNDRPLGLDARPTRALLNKLLQSLNEEDGITMLYTSPYNELGVPLEGERRVEWWNFDLAEQLYRFPALQSVRAFLEHGTGTSPGRPAEEAQRLHDLLLHGLTGSSANYGIWGCTDVRSATHAPAAPEAPSGAAAWPAEDVSPWFHGVFWDDLVFILNPAESTLAVLALTDASPHEGHAAG